MINTGQDYQGKAHNKPAKKRGKMAEEDQVNTISETRTKNGGMIT